MPKAEPPRKAGALRRFGVTETQIEQAPKIFTIIRETMGSAKVAIETMRFSHSENIKAFLDVYDATPERDRKSIPMEAFAIKADVDFSALLGDIMLAYKGVQSQKSALLAMAAHPVVLASRIEYAQLPGGFRDRDALDTAVGFLPTPKGASIIFNQSFAPKPPDMKPTPEPAPMADAEEVDLNTVLPEISEFQNDWQANRAKLLKAEN